VQLSKYGVASKNQPYDTVFRFDPSFMNQIMKINILPQEEHHAMHGSLPGAKGLDPSYWVHENFCLLAMNI
jgi:hypothetical protein